MLKSLPAIVLFFFSFTAAALCAGDAPAGLAGIERQFSMPSADYAGAPFWSWNDKLDPVELLEQSDEFKAGGMGGFFMHARVGRITPYLSQEWMDDVRATVNHAQKTDMRAWLYDEDGYPSGFAGGLVVNKYGAAVTMKSLIMMRSAAPLDLSALGRPVKLFRVFSAKMNGDAVESFTDITPDEGAAVKQPQTGLSLLYFMRDLGSGYIDTMDPSATGKFIDITLEAYKKAVGAGFGTTVPGSFTDEPVYHFGVETPGMFTAPWTDALPAKIRAEHGYDIEKKLPLIFFDGPGAKKVRLDFWTAAVEMFRDGYDRPLFEWCAKNNLIYTGHHMGEESFFTQLNWNGGAMPHYEFMQMPGMDHLGRNIKDLVVARQVASAAHQFGRTRVLTEIYGCSGWNASPENMKWIADWHLANGVNFFVQHLSLYSMRGTRKRDYPPSNSYQSPWWKYYHILGDYLRRASYITTRGEFTADTLVLHPITSAYTMFTPNNTDSVDAYSRQFVSLVEFLTASHLDFDLGDEIIISRHGRIDGNRFIVNKMSYGSVLIPSGITLRSTTVELLGKFIAAGGRVVVIEPAPTLIDAETPLKLGGAETAPDAQAALEKLKPSLAHHVQITSSNGESAKYINVLQRDMAGTRLLFFANTDDKNEIDINVSAPYSGRVQSWDLFTGKVSDYPSASSGGTTQLTLHLEPAGSAAITIASSEPSVAVQQTKKPELVRSYPLPGKWRIARQDPNSLTLDYIDSMIEGGKAISHAQSFEIQPLLEQAGTGTKFRLRYTFNVGFDPKTAAELWFVLEQPQVYKITINGAPLSSDDSGWWRDKSFRRLDIRDKAIQGRNVVELSGTFVNPAVPGTKDYALNGVEVESAYVAGDFSVRNSDDKGYTLQPAAAEAGYYNLAARGFPFFSGSIVITQDAAINPLPGEKVFLELEGLEAMAAEVKINGVSAGVIAFHPHRVDITKLVKSGANTIDIELTDSNRNLLGPHHNILKEPLYTAPTDFKQSTFKKYNLVPFGITGGAAISYYR